MASKQDRERREPEYFDPSEVAAKQLEDAEGGGDIKVPDGATFLEVDSPGAYNLDIVPFVVGKNAKIIHPNLKPGMVHYEFTYPRHAKVGPEEVNIVCLRHFGKRCPLCDDAQDFRKSHDMNQDENKKAFAAMKAKDRTIMKVIDRDARKPRLQIFGYSWHGFAKQLAAKITGPSADQMGYKKFSRLKGGRTVQAQMSKTDMGKWLQASVIEILPRAEDLDADLLEQWGSLDEWPIERTAEEIIKIRDGATADDKGDDDDRPKRRVVKDDDDDQPKRRVVKDDDDEPAPKNKKPVDDDEDDNPAERMGLEVGSYVMYGKLRCKVAKINTAGTRCDLVEEDSDERFRSIDVTELKVGIPVEDPPVTKRKPKDDDDDDRPAKKKPAPKDDDDDDRPKRRPAAKDDDDDDDDDRDGFKKDDDDDDEPEPAPVKRGPGRPRKP